VKRFLKTLFFSLFFSSLCGQTVHLGGNINGSLCYLFNKAIKFVGDDSIYVLSTGYGAGVSGAFYFDYGGYYYRKIYGIKAEVNTSRHTQTYKVFTGPGAVNPNRYYKYKTRLSFIDIPLMFNFCPTHHQGFTVECGPQISFLTNADVKPMQSPVIPTSYPVLTKGDFRQTTFSAVLGAGLFYSFTERFALVGTFRVGYTFTDLTRRQEGISPYNPTTRFYGGAFIQAVYKINKYASSKNRGYKYYMKRIHNK